MSDATSPHATEPAGGDARLEHAAQWLATYGMLTVAVNDDDGAAYLAQPHPEDNDSFIVPVFGSLDAARLHLQNHFDLLSDPALGELIVLAWHPQSAVVLSNNFLHNEHTVHWALVDLDGNDGNKLLAAPDDLHHALVPKLGQPPNDAVVGPAAVFFIEIDDTNPQRPTVHLRQHEEPETPTNPQ